MSDQKFDSNSSKDIVLIGEIVGVFGIKGYCKINSYTDPKSNIVEHYKSGISLLWRAKKPIADFNLSKEWSEIPLEDIKSQGDSKVIAKITNCDDRDLAEMFRGVQIAIKREDLAKFDLDEDEFYWHDLEGLEVFDENGSFLGVVSHIFATGANDVLAVKNPETNNEHLVPFVYGEYVVEVDIKAKKIVVNWDMNF